MKASILSAIFASLLLGTLFAAEAKPVVFVAASSQNETYATPGTFIFTTIGDSEYLTINMFDLKISMRVTIRPSSYDDKTNPERTFDATFVSEDGLSSAIVTGRYTNTYGDGLIAIRQATQGGERLGTIKLSKFTLLPLDLDVSTDDN